jgi:DNA-binding MarR family transcriptional regulator
MCNDVDGKLPAFDLDGFAPYRLAKAAQRVSEDLARLYRARFGISIPEWRVLAHLAQAGGTAVSVRDIEARVGLEKSTVSRAATRLAGAGYVEKRTQTDDRRLVSLRLTAKGREVMAELLPLAEAYQDALAARLGSAYAALDTGLAALLAEDAP